MLTILIRAFIAAVFAGFLCGLMGVHITRLNLNTVAFSTAHAALAGAALAMFLGMEPSTIGLILAILTALFLGPLADLFHIPFDLFSMSLFSIYTAFAFIFISISPGGVISAQAVSSILWGSILTVTSGYTVFLSILFFLVLIYIIAFFPQLKSLLFDSKLAEAEGINVKAYKYSLMFLSGVTVSLILKLVGGFLVFSLLFIPAASAFLLSENIKLILCFSAILGSFSAVGGIFLSLLLDLPTGACIVLMATFILIISAVYAHFFGRLRK